MNAFVDDLDTQALLEHWLAVEEAIRDGARHRLPSLAARAAVRVRR